MSVDSTSRKHILTVAVEDYFQLAGVRGVVDESQWYRFETRVEKNTERALDLLDSLNQTATFFVLGWIAENCPEVVRSIVDRGHEVATKGQMHRSPGETDEGKFREDLLRSREALARASGRRILGHRIANGWFGTEDLWALDILAQEGFVYDSSLRPLGLSHANARSERFAHLRPTKFGDLWEFPIATWTALGVSLPISGGNHQRQFPQWLVRGLVSNWHRRYRAPYVMYFHVWDLDPELPRLAGTSTLQRLRMYRNLESMQGRIREFLETYSFQSIAEHLTLDPSLPMGERLALDLDPDSWDMELPPARVDRRPRVSIVVPCYNEEPGLPYLKRTLKSVEARLSPSYRLEFLFVDDGSRDRTWQVLERLFGSRPDCRLLRHEENRGIAAALYTGIRQARSEIVCTIDADCTYDPHDLVRFLPALTDDVDMVTASPYHPDGEVRNVPGWRLFLSKGLSRLYSRLLPVRLATYTSCFRVLRRSKVLELELEHQDFLGIAEMLALLSLSGGRVVELPARLEARLLGVSKMKTLRTIRGHLGLLAQIARRKESK